MHCILNLLFATLLVILSQSAGLNAQADDLIAAMTHDDLNGFKWLHQPESFSVEDGKFEVQVAGGTDYFNNPEDGNITGNAPFLWRTQRGDFIAVARVSPDFTDQWNACALMIHVDSLNWIKFAFENSDATGNSIVTVVTKGVSDDANGAVLESAKSVWLKLIRKGDNYSMLWSKDGSEFKMARLTNLPSPPAIKVGVEFQCPVGKTATHMVSHLSIDERSVADMRKGL